MPTWLDNLCSISGLISFVLSIFTFINTCKLKTAILNTKERADYKNNYTDLIARIEGFILSLEHDYPAVDLSTDIDTFLCELLEAYSFLKKQPAYRHIHHLKLLFKVKKFRNHTYIKTLTSLKIQLKKEAQYD